MTRILVLWISEHKDTINDNSVARGFLAQTVYLTRKRNLGCDQALLVWKERSDGHFVKFRAVVQRVRVPPDQS